MTFLLLIQWSIFIFCVKGRAGGASVEEINDQPKKFEERKNTISANQNNSSSSSSLPVSASSSSLPVERDTSVFEDSSEDFLNKGLTGNFSKQETQESAGSGLNKTYESSDDEDEEEGHDDDYEWQLLDHDGGTIVLEQEYSPRKKKKDNGEADMHPAFSSDQQQEEVVAPLEKGPKRILEDLSDASPNNSSDGDNPRVEFGSDPFDNWDAEEHDNAITNEDAEYNYEDGPEEEQYNFEDDEVEFNENEDDHVEEEEQDTEAYRQQRTNFAGYEEGRDKNDNFDPASTDKLAQTGGAADPRDERYDRYYRDYDFDEGAVGHMFDHNSNNYFPYNEPDHRNGDKNEGKGREEKEENAPETDVQNKEDDKSNFLVGDLVRLKKALQTALSKKIRPQPSPLLFPGGAEGRNYQNTSSSSSNQKQTTGAASASNDRPWWDERWPGQVEHFREQTIQPQFAPSLDDATFNVSVPLRKVWDEEQEKMKNKNTYSDEVFQDKNEDSKVSAEEKKLFMYKNFDKQLQAAVDADRSDFGDDDDGYEKGKPFLYKQFAFQTPISRSGEKEEVNYLAHDMAHYFGSPFGFDHMPGNFIRSGGTSMNRYPDPTFTQSESFHRQYTDKTDEEYENDNIFLQPRDGTITIPSQLVAAKKFDWYPDRRMMVPGARQDELIPQDKDDIVHDPYTYWDYKAFCPDDKTEDDLRQGMKQDKDLRYYISKKGLKLSDYLPKFAKKDDKNLIEEASKDEWLTRPKDSDLPRTYGNINDFMMTEEEARKQPPKQHQMLFRWSSKNEAGPSSSSNEVVAPRQEAMEENENSSEVMLHLPLNSARLRRHFKLNDRIRDPLEHQFSNELAAYYEKLQRENDEEGERELDQCEYDHLEAASTVKSPTLPSSFLEAGETVKSESLPATSFDFGVPERETTDYMKLPQRHLDLLPQRHLDLEGEAHLDLEGEALDNMEAGQKYLDVNRRGDDIVLFDSRLESRDHMGRVLDRMMSGDYLRPVSGDDDSVVEYIKRLEESQDPYLFGKPTAKIPEPIWTRGASSNSKSASSGQKKNYNYEANKEDEILEKWNELADKVNKQEARNNLKDWARLVIALENENDIESGLPSPSSTASSSWIHASRLVTPSRTNTGSFVHASQLMTPRTAGTSFTMVDPVDRVSTPEDRLKGLLEALDKKIPPNNGEEEEDVDPELGIADQNTSDEVQDNNDSSDLESGAGKGDKTQAEKDSAEQDHLPPLIHWHDATPNSPVQQYMAAPCSTRKSSWKGRRTQNPRIRKYRSDITKSAKYPSYVKANFKPGEPMKFSEMKPPEQQEGMASSSSSPQQGMASSSSSPSGFLETLDGVNENARIPTLEEFLQEENKEEEKVEGENLPNMIFDDGHLNACLSLRNRRANNRRDSEQSCDSNEFFYLENLIVGGL